MNKMRILGIDYGEARVGIAITDELNITAQGLETIQRNGSDKIILKRLDEIIEKYQNIDTIVVRNATKHEWNNIRKSPYNREICSQIKM